MSADHRQAQLVADDLAPPKPEAACVNWATCQNITPGGVETGNEMCDACLAEARQNGDGIQ